MRALVTEQWLKHRTFVVATGLLIVGLVAGLYVAETSMLQGQIVHVLGLPGMDSASTIEALASELVSLTPGRAPDHGLALTMATLLGTVLAAILGARLGASEYRWHTAAGFAVRHRAQRTTLINLATALVILFSWTVLAALTAIVAAAIACGVIGTQLSGFAAYVWREPAGNVLLQLVGATVARFLDVGVALVVAALTRSTLLALAAPLGASIGQLALVGETAPGSWLPTVTQVSVWDQLLRYPTDGGLLYPPLGSNGMPLVLTLTTTLVTAVVLSALAHLVSTRRELQAS